jgi:hypothetical protein
LESILKNSNSELFFPSCGSELCGPANRIRWWRICFHNLFVETEESYFSSKISKIVPLQENAGNPERIRLSLAAAGQRRYLEGVERRQLDMLGPVLNNSF